MSNIYSLIAFLSLFAVALFALDYFLPRKTSFVEQIIESNGDRHIIYSPEELQSFENIKDHRIVLREATPILNLDISYTGDNSIQVQTNYSTTLIYFPGLAFLIFLGIGSCFGLFFKKPEYLERRAAYFNLILGGLVLLLFVLC